MPDLRFATPTGEFGAYLAQPIDQGPHAGVVVIQDALGLSDDIREQADRLGAAGYLAFAPDLYSGRGVRCVVATMLASRSGKGAAYEEIDAARAFLAAREDCTGRIGIICPAAGGETVVSAPGLACVVMPWHPLSGNRGYGYAKRSVGQIRSSSAGPCVPGWGLAA